MNLWFPFLSTSSWKNPTTFESPTTKEIILAKTYFQIILPIRVETLIPSNMDAWEIIIAIKEKPMEVVPSRKLALHCERCRGNKQTKVTTVGMRNKCEPVVWPSCGQSEPDLWTVNPKHHSKKNRKKYTKNSKSGLWFFIQQPIPCMLDPQFDCRAKLKSF